MPATDLPASKDAASAADELLWRERLASVAAGERPETSSVRFIAHFFNAYRLRSGITVTLLIFAGIAEGVGLVALLPALEAAVSQAQGTATGPGQWLLSALARVGIRDPGLAVLLALIVAAMAAKGLFLWLAMRQVGFTVARVAADLRRRLIRALTDAQWDLFTRQPAGHLASALGMEAHRASWAYKHGCEAIARLVQALAYLVVICLVAWKVALLAALGLLVLSVGFTRLVQASRTAGQSQTRLLQSMMGRLGQLLPAVKPLKAMGRERAMWRILDAETGRIDEAQRQAVTAWETLSCTREPALVAILCLGLYLALGVSGMQFALVVPLAVFFYRLMIALGEAQSQYQNMVGGESAFWSLHAQILAAEAAVELPDAAGRRLELSRAIELRRVTFSRGGAELFRDLSVRIPAGTLCAITGPSGIGKTTLIDLIVGLQQPTAGQVLIDGVPLPELDQQHWRSRIGYVAQDRILLNDTVLANVTLGDESLSRDHVQRALEMAGAWDFVARLEHGLEQQVGERGMRLSGGQGQRLAIARALVHQPRLLILDEATSNLDPAVAEAIVRTLNDLKGELTIIAISHQDLFHRVADQVVELAAGRGHTLVKTISGSAAE